MKKVPLFLVLILPVFCFSQTHISEDELINNMCNEFTNSTNFSDSARVENIKNKFLVPYLKKYETAKVDSVAISIYFRLQRNCESFSRFLDKIDPQENWEEVREMPISKLSNVEKDEFLKKSNFFYLEGNGDKTEVRINKGFWIERFVDGTFSKNKMVWKNESDFELEFIESNNEGRKGFSRKGDKYFYRIIDTKDNFYRIAAEISNQNRVLVFKLYFKKLIQNF